MTVRIFVCARCFNFGGTLLNKGTRLLPLYVHAPGQCREMNYAVRNDCFSRRPGFWLFLMNMGVDFNREEALA